MHPVITGKRNRLNKLISLPLGIACIDVCLRAEIGFGLRLNNGAVSFFDTFPSVVPVHRIKTPAKCRNRDILIGDRFDLL